MTAACCLHVIRALLLFRVHSRGSPNLLFSFIPQKIFLIACRCVIHCRDCPSEVFPLNNVLIQCSVIRIDILTIMSFIQMQRDESPRVKREFNCYRVLQNISFSVFDALQMPGVSYDFYVLPDFFTAATPSISILCRLFRRQHSRLQ
jgi:hypothetical protein